MKDRDEGRNSGLTNRQKLGHLMQLAEYREEVLRKKPRLHSLFLEMTAKCNEHCMHCGSNCGDFAEVDALSKEELCEFLDRVKAGFPMRELMLCVTGGEPLLRKDFFEIMDYANRLGFTWGMTSNGTLISREVAHRLAECGMRTISISVDGLRETHEWFRQSPGSYDKTMRGIRNLLEEGAFSHVQITTVVHQRNFQELEAMYREFSQIGVRSWRVIGIEPIGRAKSQANLLLSAQQQKELMDFIVAHRFAGPMEVCYGCSHFLGLSYEREVRPWYFLCNAGVYTASVTYNGDITACLDIERHPDVIQGNIRRDDFKEVWNNRFRIFRNDYKKAGRCAECEDYVYCAGGACHTWDYDGMDQQMCMRDLLG